MHGPCFSAQQFNLNGGVAELVTSLDLQYPASRHRPQVRRIARAAKASVHHEPARERRRRALNVCAAVVGLVLAGPAMLVIAVLIRLTSPGPILYTQARIGLDRRGNLTPTESRRRMDLGGRPFTIYKFRTMQVQTLDRDAEVWATPDDPRVTPVGRVLRKLRLDELPQLWNVLRGDMNVVGPRPEQPSIFLQMREQIEHYELRQRVRPGITGWAQVRHTYDQSVDDVRRKVALDLEYVGRQSVLEDIKIMALTVPVIVGRRGGW